jgi:4-amino-4-deoxy-L-arabinose transferase-like glycosyltransferase
VRVVERSRRPAPSAPSDTRRPQRLPALAALRRIPPAAWACAAIAFVNAALWAAITPSFQIPDEIDHSGYVQYVAERGDLPDPRRVLPPPYAPDLAVAAGLMPFTVEGRPNWSPFQGRRSDRVLRHAGRSPDGTGSGAVNNPPLYYVLDAGAYRLARGAPYLDRLYVMRLGSALLAGLCVLFVFLFVREVLPGTRWSWPIGALAVAFQPVFGFMAGGVNNDILLYTAGAALLFVFARCFRRGLTPGRGVALGLAVLAGLLAKSTFLAFVPGVLIGCALLVWRAPPARRPALRGAGVAAAVAALPFLAWIAINQQVFERGATTTGGYTSETVAQGVTVKGQLTYLWTYFLPKLPFMGDYFPRDYPVWDTYFQAFVGRFGWFQYAFPEWASYVALGIVAVLAVLAALAISRAHLLRTGRWAEVLTYASLLGGLLLFVNVAAYRYLSLHHTPFEQTRYLFPLLGLWGLFVAVAARGAGRRWGPAVGGLLVVLVMAHSLFAMLLTLSRYYA